ncbi:MAG: enoyl-CoA hydratase-related protein [Planctomycetota bacterium]|jgi:enoyl-CoA hydratase|nr:enoyl-CoA hydratase-related protein [Planctomycetota bacterium]
MSETLNNEDSTSQEYQFLQVEVDDQGIAWLEISRPKALNALNADVLDELRDAMVELVSYEDVLAIVITGAGDKSFVAGADITQFVDMEPAEARAMSQNGQDVMATIEASPIPVIAMINGFALGGGLELAMACHLRVASTAAKLGLPEVSLALIPGFAGTQRLARLTSPGVAREWILTGDMYSAEQALAVGVVNRVVAPEELRETTAKLAKTIIKRGPVAVATALEVIRRGLEVGQTEGENIEADCFGFLFSTEDQKEGAAAFLAKRAPEFHGR